MASGEGRLPGRCGHPGRLHLGCDSACVTSSTPAQAAADSENEAQVYSLRGEVSLIYRSID